MIICEREVYITPDGLGRAAIVERSDRFLTIYTHWIWSAHSREEFNVQQGGRLNWREDRTVIADLYADVEPQPGLYDTLESARTALKELPGFSDALLGINEAPR